MAARWGPRRVAMPKKDLRKENKALYAASADEVVELDVPKIQYVAVDGVGDPNTAFSEAIGALYSVAYRLKFALKRDDASKDFVVMAPEALYDAQSPGSFALLPRDKWRWKLLLALPVHVPKKLLDKSIADAKASKPNAFLDGIHLERLEEGHCVQTLHVGPYSTEHETIARMHAYMREHGEVAAGPHHEIYLGDPNRSPPEKLRTIVRQPVKPAA